jgi:PPOX class probable F420-dependent enzyme
MGPTIPERLADLLTREKKAFAALALTLSDGTPQVTPIWFDFEDGLIVINTARGRVKDKVLRRHPVVALVVSDPHDPYRYLLIKGPVVAETEEGALAKINDLNVKYRGHPNYPLPAGQVRVTYKVRPECVFPEK